MLADEDGVELLTTAEVAKLCGFARASDVRSYVTRKHPRGNPFPPADRKLDDRTPLWRKPTIEAWLHRRPGEGARTDRYGPSASYD